MASISNPGDTIRLPYEEVKNTLLLVLRKFGFTEERAELCSTLFTETSLDGIYSHGLNRFPLFAKYLRLGIVQPANEPDLIQSTGNIEKWDGKLGVGNLNAWFCMDRAIQLAKQSGMGMVTIRNTNHWMRGGSYGLQAAAQNCIGICITNTIPNMPPWGGQEPKVGNNPLILCVPHEPYPVLLDMAVSQFAYGKLELLKRQGEKLPFPGGFNKDLKLSEDPEEILESNLALPTGYWKGSGLAVLLDLLVSLLSEGLTSTDIGKHDMEQAVSQLFLAIDLDLAGSQEERERKVADVLESITGCKPMEPGGKVHYPGQQTWSRRMENMKSGIPVLQSTWDRITGLLD
jgi:3-dehydro-L-gulonate 2-dehydrogenase